MLLKACSLVCLRAAVAQWSVANAGSIAAKTSMIHGPKLVCKWTHLSPWSGIRRRQFHEFVCLEIIICWEVDTCIWHCQDFQEFLCLCVWLLMLWVTCTIVYFDSLAATISAVAWIISLFLMLWLVNYCEELCKVEVLSILLDSVLPAHSWAQGSTVYYWEKVWKTFNVYVLCWLQYYLRDFHVIFWSENVAF